MASVEERIGYKFRNSLLLAEALTHPSLAHETQQPHFDNQRLEYLGDAVIQLVFTEHLFRLYPDAGEGRLTKLRARLVSGEALQSYAQGLELGQFLMMGRGDENSGGRHRASTLADAFEALTGALFLDSGGSLDTVRRFLLAQAEARLGGLDRQPLEVNPKGQLQEILQSLPLPAAPGGPGGSGPMAPGDGEVNAPATAATPAGAAGPPGGRLTGAESVAPRNPTYAILSSAGPDHAKRFVAQVEWAGLLLGTGEGHSKQQAEIAAALDALRTRRWQQAALRGSGVLASADGAEPAGRDGR